MPMLWSLDSPSYARIAWEAWAFSTLSDPRLGVLRLPGYPVFLAGLYSFGGPRAELVLFAQAVLGILSAFLGGAIASMVSSSRSGVLAVAAIIAFSPLYLTYEHALMSETLALLLLLVGTALAIRIWSEGPGVATAAALGATMAALILTRPNAVPFVAILAGFACARAVLRPADKAGRQYSRAAATRFLVVGALAALALILPWLVRNAEYLGRPVLLDSIQRFRLYYAMERRLLRVDSDLRLLTGEETGAKELPREGVFWRLVSLGASGEDVAGDLLAAARRERPVRFLLERFRVFSAYVGWGERTPAAIVWLRRSVEHREPGDRSPAARISRFLQESAREPGVRINAAMQRGCDIYSRYVQKFMTVALLAAIVWTCRLWMREGAASASLRTSSMLLVAYLATAGIHAWTLVGYERFAALFDWVPVVVIVSLLGSRRNGSIST